MPLSSHTTAGTGRLGTLLISQPRGGQQEVCGPGPTGALDAIGLQTRGVLAPIQQVRGLPNVGLFNVGIFHLKGPILSAMPGESIVSQVTVAELYCERMDLTLPELNEQASLNPGPSRQVATQAANPSW